MRSELAKMDELVDEMDVAVLVTRGPRGLLVARTISKPQLAPGADCWFVITNGSDGLDELRDPHVNLTLFRSKSDEWLSIEGVAKVSPRTGRRSGTTSRRRRKRIGVEVKAVVGLQRDMPAPLVLFERQAEPLSGEPANLGRIEYLHRPSLEII